MKVLDRFRERQILPTKQNHRKNKLANNKMVCKANICLTSLDY